MPNDWQPRCLLVLVPQAEPRCIGGRPAGVNVVTCNSRLLSITRSQL
eukprot:COSAG06_NODE_65541_length_256_cov_2.197452_1_plen_46_part_01